MNVFAHYCKTEDGIEYRWRTLLQFGNSWDVIGTIIMKNPGSSTPTEDKINNAVQQQLQKFDNNIRQWYHFSSDNTMLNIEKLFKAYYHYSKGDSTLNGVIQIFNLFNIRNADLNKALKAIENNGVTLLPFYKTVDEDITQIKWPVYLGWGGLGFDSLFQPDAERIFNVVLNDKNGKYLHTNYHDNRFYHPQYLMGRGKNRPNSQYLLNAFCQNTISPSYTQFNVPNFSFSVDNVFDIVCEDVNSKLSLKKIEKDSTPKLCRFILNGDLALTITKQGKGYIGIRHINYKEKYSIKDYLNARYYASLLDEFGFNTTSDVWLGAKMFKEYGCADKAIVNGIIEEIQQIKESIKNI